MRRKRLIAAAALLTGGWLAYDFAGFWRAATAAAPEPPAKVDAIVVLTGGAARVQAGLALLASGEGDRLFISGAGASVETEDLVGQGSDQSPAFKARIALGRARDTVGNAKETADWAKANGVSSIRLVTAYYHLPRSLLLLKRAAPGLEIWPTPVEPPGASPENWTMSGRGMALIAGEWLKFLSTRLGLTA